jgi:predicted permease
MIAAVMVLAVACANVASLQLARARARQPEIVTRLSLGASRARVLRQLVTESALLGLTAGAGALPATWLLLRWLARLAADAMPPEYGTLVFRVSPDPALFAFVCGVSLAAGVAFGLAPAIVSSGASLVTSSRVDTMPRTGRRLQRTLISVQVAFSLVLLIAGSLLINSAVRSVRADPGYDAAHVVSVEFQFPEAARYAPDRQEAIARDLRARIGALGGVASVTSAQPPGLAFVTAVATVDDAVGAPPRQSLAPYVTVEPSYFKTVGIPIRQGTELPAVANTSARQVILSESAARDLWPHQQAVGRRVRLGPTNGKPHATSELTADGPVFDVVAIARDTRGVNLTANDARLVYVLRGDDGLATRPLLVSVGSDPAEVLRAIAPTAAAVDRNLLVTVSTLEDQLRTSGTFIISSLSAILASTLGMMGLFLAAMGIGGTVSYVVANRTREFGVRLAIGAKRRDILRLVLGENAPPVVIGLGAGMVLAIGVSVMLRDTLYGVGLADASTFAAVSLLFLGVALLAALPPALRATRVQPVVALRSE